MTRRFAWLNWVGLPFVVTAVILVPDWPKLIEGPALAFALPSILCFTFVCAYRGELFRDVVHPGESPYVSGPE